MSQYDLVVIGAGSGGVRAARMAANFGAKVAVIEDRYLGEHVSTWVVFRKNYMSMVRAALSR